MTEAASPATPATLVRCNASACAHWLPGDRCSAAVIRVSTQDVPAASDPGQTCCRTYLHRRGLGQVLATADNLNWGGLAREPLAPGVQLSPEVRCGVTACLYWRPEERCAAPAIQIAGEGATLPEETDCGTFLPAGR